MQPVRSNLLAVTALGAAVLLSACATPDPNSPNVPNYQSRAPSTTYPAPSSAPSYPAQAGTVVEPRYSNTGIVSSIELIRGQSASGISPGGAIIGAVVGGVLGNQVGEGRGRTAATVVGAGAGALAGNAVGNRVNSTSDQYRVGIRYDNGASQYIDVPNPGDLRTGDRVRVDGNEISRY